MPCTLFIHVSVLDGKCCALTNRVSLLYHCKYYFYSFKFVCCLEIQRNIRLGENDENY